MSCKTILPFFILWTLSFSPVLGQAIADFNFEDNSDVPNSLLKNSVAGAPDALRIHPNARGIDGGVYVVQDETDPGHENINLDLPEELFIPYPEVYLEWEYMVQEEALWLINGRGPHNSGIFHHSVMGFNIRYYTLPAPDAEPVYHHTNFSAPAIPPLEKNVISKIGFYYNQEEGLAYLFVNGVEKWRSDSHFQATPGEPLYWMYEEDFITVGANSNGDGSDTPSLYRFRIMETPCPEVSPPQASGTQVCPGETAILTATGGADGSYRWYESENALQPVAGFTGDSFPTPALENPVTYFVSLMDGDCESERIPVTAEILPLPDAPLAEDQENCGPGAVTLTASGGNEGSYRWYTAPSGSSPIETGGTFTTEVLTSSKAFYVSVTNANGCESTRTRAEAIIHPLPLPPATQNIDQCGPGEVAVNLKTQNNTDAASFRWYRRKEDTAPSQEENTHLLKVKVTRDTVLYVSTSKGNCESEKVPIYIKVHELPELEAGEDQTILKGESVQLLATGDITGIKWSPKKGLDMDNIMSPMANPSYTITYTVTGTNSGGCEVTDTVTVHVTTDYPVPNAFSPNQDGLNDLWEIPLIDQYPRCRIAIYNRWGNQIFYSEGYPNPWDGTFNGKELPSGTYYYSLQLNEELEVKGTLSLIR